MPQGVATRSFWDLRFANSCLDGILQIFLVHMMPSFHSAARIDWSDVQRGIHTARPIPATRPEFFAPVRPANALCQILPPKPAHAGALPFPNADATTQRGSRAALSCAPDRVWDRG